MFEGWCNTDLQSRLQVGIKYAKRGCLANWCEWLIAQIVIMSGGFNAVSLGQQSPYKNIPAQFSPNHSESTIIFY